MNSVDLSVIIPTHNRLEILQENLKRLSQNDCSPQSFEVVVVDGGSTDGTSEWITAHAGEFPFRLKSLRQGDRGPGANRNLGLRHAEGRLVLFMNDDVLPNSTFLREHIIFHENHPAENIAMLGCVIQAPELRVTPFMKIFEPFPYFLIKGEENLNYCFFWTCNLSLKRNFLFDHGLFDESVAYPAHEDIELGHRLEKKGLKILYHPRALGYHYHLQTFEGECHHQRMMGYYLYFLWENVMDWRIYEWSPMIYWGTPIPALIKKIIRHIGRLIFFNDLTVPYFFRPIIRILESHPRLSTLALLLYWKVLTYYARKGIGEGLRSRSYHCILNLLILKKKH